MSFLSNMPSRNAANFSLMLSGDARAGGSHRQPAAAITEYIALNDTRPPEGQVIGMCQGHSVLGYNWHQHVSCPTSDKQRGLKRPGSSGGSSGFNPRVTSTTSSAAKASSAVGGPQSRNSGGLQGCWGDGGGGIRSAANGSRKSTESTNDNDNDAVRAPDHATSSLSKGNPSQTTGEAVDSKMGAPPSRGAAIAVQGEGNMRGSEGSSDARGLLGGSRSGTRGGSSSFSTAAGRGRGVSISGEGESVTVAAAGAPAATNATTRGRVGMKKARRTYGR